MTNTNKIILQCNITCIHMMTISLCILFLSMPISQLKKYLGHIIFEVNTPISKRFDVILLWFILLSVVIVILESVPTYASQYKSQFFTAELILTWLFTIEYFIRLRVARKRRNYIYSFYGIVDLVSILPTYIALVFSGAQALAVVRALRLLRVFRILKMTRYIWESNLLMKALYASRRKITVFIVTIVLIVTIAGSIMYLVEGKASGFDSIPRSMYRAIVTITTVGYGDISPTTPFWQFLASCLMIVWYAVIAVPTGIVTSEITLKKAEKRLHKTKKYRREQT